MAAFASTPAFEIFRRGLIVETVKRFRGINIYQTFAALGPEWAQDCLNVIVGSDGALHKFRLPQTISPAVGNFVTGPQTFIDFQQANGTRQVLAFFGTTMVVFTVDMTVSTTIETNALNAGLWSLAVLKNMLFGTNGQRMQKWLGTPIAAASWQAIGIAAPTVQPSVVLSNITSVTRAANVVTVVLATPVDLRAAFDVVQISGVTDASFNGTFQVAAFTDQTHFTYNQTAANAASVGGTVSGSGQNPNYNIATLARVAGVTTATVTASSNTTPGLGADFLASARKLQIVIAGAADASFNGTFTVISKQGNVLTFNQPVTADLSVGAAGTLQGTWAWATGMSVGFAYRNSVTGHIGNFLTLAGPFLGPFIGVNGTAPRSLTFTAPASPDAQVDSVVWYRTLDGGGDFFFAQIENGNGGPATLVMPDSMLDQSQKGALINNPPVQGKFMAVGQGRLFVANLVGAPQDIIYSGYEQILVGNPPESFPPNNRLRLSIGAESCNGVGVLQNGVVGFSQTGKMFMLRGNVQDITVTVPVVFTQYLQELPWQLGCLSHWSIQATPYGLVWLAADKTVQFFDGSNPPEDISKPIYPILRNITQGTEGSVVSAYFNWLDRDWYVLAVATGGSQTNNRLYLWSLDAETKDIEMFVSDIQADYVGMVTSSLGLRQLIIAQAGRLKNLPAAQDTAGGLVSDLTLIPSTNGQLNAYWRSMYAGNQNPEQSKTFRWGRLVTDQAAFLVQQRLVDDESRTFLQPEIRGPYQVKGGNRFGINRKGKRCSIEIDFPVQDVSANVIEMQIAHIGTTQR